MARFGAAGQAAVVGLLVVVLGALGVTGYALACSTLAAPTITSEPTNPTTSTSASFTYKDSASGVTFKCSLDSAAFATCTSTGISYSGLAQGSHTFKVEAVSGSSTSSATSYTWAIVPPAPTITSEPSNPTTSTSAAFKYTDTLSGVSFLCSLNGASFSSCSSSGVTYTITTGGSNTFSVEAQVGSNTPSAAATYTWTVTTLTPTIISEPANPVASSSASFTYSDTQAGVSFKCSLDGSSFSSCSSSGVSYSSLADGTYTFEVEAQLGSGPASSPATYSWRVDTTAPTVTLTFPITQDSYSSASWATGCSPTGICGTAADPSGVKSVSVGILQASSGKYWNGTSFSSSSVVFNTATGTTSWDYAFAAPPVGTYSIYVRATDNLGNSTPTSQTCVAVFYIVVPSPHAIAVYSGSPQSTTVGTVFSSPLVAKVTDQLGNPFSGASVTFTAPTSGASGTFASPCSGTTCVVTTNSSGLASAPTFTANTVAGGPYTVSASVTGVSSTANFSLTSNPGPAKKLAFITSPVSGTASTSATLGPITVQLQDAYGNPVTATGSGTVVGLSSSSGAGIFSSSSGASHITSVTIASGKTSASFYYGDTKAGSPTITAASSPLTSATQTETITAGKAAKLAFTTSPVSGPLSSSATLGPITIQLQDAYGNPVTATGSGTVVKLTSSSSGGIFAASSGGSHITSITITSGNSSAIFYYGDTVTGTPTITASSCSFTSATQTETITGSATKLVFITSPVTGAASNSAELGPITVQVQNASGSAVNVAVSTTVDLSSNSTGTYIFNSNQGAASPTGVTSVTIPAGSSSVTFYYGDTKAGTPTITAASSPLTSATQTETITAGTPVSIKIVSGNNQFTTVNTNFTYPLVVQVTDAYGNPVPNASVTFTAPTSGATGTFATCSGGNPTANECVLSTNASGLATSSTIKANTAAGGPYNVSAATSGPAPVYFSLQNNPAAAFKLAFSVEPPSSIPATSTFGVAVTIEDTYGNVVTTDTNTVALTLTNNTCGGTLSGTASKAAMAGVASFPGLQVTTACIGYTLTATDAADSNISVVSSPFNVTAGSANAISVVSGNNQSATQGAAFAKPLVVEVTDQYGNLVPNASVIFKAPTSGASGTFSDSSNTITSTTGSNGQLSESFTANNTGGQYTVAATTPGASTPADFTLLNGENFTINGSIPASTPLYPGTSQPVDLVITNPNPESITVALGSVSVSITTTPLPPSTSCPASNYAFVPSPTPTMNVVIPAGSTMSLSQLSVPEADWPSISMIDTSTNQDNCEGATLNFTWSATGSGS
jgi:hypothetical protein